MDEVIEHARKLGAAIAAHAHCAALRSATKALKEDDEARRLEKDYAAIAQLIAEKGGTGKPIEPDEKRREADLRSKMASHPAVRDFLRAQADFHQLMHAVNKTLEEAIGLED